MKNVRKVFREMGHEWCEVTIELRENNNDKLVLSICGKYGYIATVEEAIKQAKEYWVSFVEDNPAERMNLCDAAGKLMNAEACAEYILDHDGQYHSLDVHSEDGDKVYISTSWGQIRDEIVKFFPAIEQYLKWHLNDMHSECIHQEARGETYDKTPNAKCKDCGYKIGSAS